MMLAPILPSIPAIAVVMLNSLTQVWGASKGMSNGVLTDRSVAQI